MAIVPTMILCDIGAPCADEAAADGDNFGGILMC